MQGLRLARTLRLTAAAALFLVLFSFAGEAQAASVSPEPIWQTPADGLNGTGAGRLTGVEGVAADPTSGKVFALDRNNARVDVFSAFGSFEFAWGWGVATGAAQLETCGPAASPPTAACRAGVQGSGPGQFLHDIGSGGIAVGPEGDVYVGDMANHRVQKFTAAGEFVLMFGKGVDQGPSTPGDVCTAASLAGGEVCGAGALGTGNGEFATEEPGTYIAAAGDGTVFVGDEGRIQKFAPAGSFEETITLTGTLAGETVTSLALGPEGALWVTAAHEGHAFVHKLSPVGVDLLTPPLQSEESSSTELKQPLIRVATDEAGDVYMAAFNLNPRDVAEEEFKTGEIKEVLEYASDGTPIISAPNGLSVLSGNESFFKGIAVTTVTAGGALDLIAAIEEREKTFLRAYGAVPTKFGPPPKAAPEILTQSEAATTATSAQVSASINPHFWADTSYYVEYGTGNCSEGGCSTQTPLPPGAALSSNDAGIPIQAQPVTLTGLTPATTYHFRVVAQSSGSDGQPVRGVGGTVTVAGGEGTFTTGKEAALPSAADCPNLGFRFGPAQQLADCRAYEMVTPIDKNQVDILPLPNINNDRDILDQSTPDGSALTYTTSQGFGEAEGVPYVSQYLATRGDGGWSSQDLTPPQGISGTEPGNRVDLEFRAFTEDLCAAYLIHTTDPPLAPGAPEGVFNIYRRQICGAKALESVTHAPLPAKKDPLDFRPILQAISADGRCGAYYRFEYPGLYESCEGSEQEIGVLPSGRVSAVASVGTRGDKIGVRTGTTKSAVSANGTRVYWTDGPNGHTTDAPFETTVLLRVNADQSPSALANGGAWGEGTLTSGSSVIEGLTAAGGSFKTGQDIVGEGIPDATTIVAVSSSTLTLSKPAERSMSEARFEASSPCAEPAKACTLRLPRPSGLEHTKSDSERFWAATPDGNSVLYSFSNGTETQLLKYNWQSGQLVTVTTEMVGGLLGASTDLNRFAFASTEVLTTQANPIGAKAANGKPNLYLFDGSRSGAKRFIFVGTLDKRDAQMFPTRAFSALAEEPYRHVSRITPSGAAVSFMSIAPLTGYDNTDAVSGEKDLETFLYNEEANGGAGTLVCVSCNPGGSRPTGRRIILSGFPSLSWGASLLPPYYTELTGPRALSSDGRHVFFNSYEPLIGSDTNGKADVYEWEAPGTDGSQGKCTVASPVYSSANGGCITLISSGTGSSDSELIDASPSGADVFFSTVDSLVPEDPGLFDIYDAREDGGFALHANVEPCDVKVEGSCQPLSAAPSSPASQSGQVRAGNRCPKGMRAKKVKKGSPVRCVSKHKRNHHKKKHHRKKKGKHHHGGKANAKNDKQGRGNG